MPPPIPEHQKRFTANPTRPARYRPGKAVPEEESSEEEEDEEEVQQPRKPVRKPQARSTVPRIQAAPAEDEDEDDEEGFVTDDDDEDDAPGGAPVASNSAASNSASAAPTAKPISAAQRIPKPPVEDDEDEEDSGSEDEESDESDEESSSEDEAPQRKFQRPTFVKKTDRIQKAENRTEDIPEAKATPAPDIVSSHHDQDVAARRLAEAETMIKATIERDTAARLAGKKSWDDDDDLPPEALVDDTDGVDPEAEHSAWRLRELHRLKRDREVMVAREKELEEIERRRNLTAEERDAEDKEFLEKQKADREDGRGKAALLSKYHHKGAFFMDDEDSKRLAQRDLIGAKFADDVDKSTLPEYMRIRDMTKLGKKGRTRYTDLKGQDTGRFGDDVKRWKGSGYNNDNGPRDDLRGVDERFLPDSDRGGPTASGANASVVGIRRERRRSRSRSVNVSDRRRDQGGKDSYLPRSRSRSRSRDKRRRRYSSSRSRSPKRSRSRSLPRGSRRRRTPSPYHDRDKRRRIET